MSRNEQSCVLHQPRSWPFRTLLVLTNYHRQQEDGTPVVGFVVSTLGMPATQENGFVVFVGSPCEVDRDGTSLLAMPRESFADAGALYDAGWRVN